MNHHSIAPFHIPTHFHLPVPTLPLASRRPSPWFHARVSRVAGAGPGSAHAEHLRPRSRTAHRHTAHDTPHGSSRTAGADAIPYCSNPRYARVRCAGYPPDARTAPLVVPVRSGSPRASHRPPGRVALQSCHLSLSTHSPHKALATRIDTPAPSRAAFTTRCPSGIDCTQRRRLGPR